MNLSPSIETELFGLFELDTTGIVLYHRIDPMTEPCTGSPGMAGRNFYDEIAPFENREEFRRCVTQFTLGAKTADSFDFDCRYEGNAQPVRVLLARIRDGMNPDHTKSVLVHIRRAAERTEAVSEVALDG
jgi:hypothetical protein